MVLLIITQRQHVEPGLSQPTGCMATLCLEKAHSPKIAWKNASLECERGLLTDSVKKNKAKSANRATVIFPGIMTSKSQMLDSVINKPLKIYVEMKVLSDYIVRSTIHSWKKQLFHGFLRL